MKIEFEAKIRIISEEKCRTEEEVIWGWAEQF